MEGTVNPVIRKGEQQKRISGLFGMTRYRHFPDVLTCYWGSILSKGEGFKTMGALLALALFLTIVFPGGSAGADEVWQDSKQYGIFFEWYAPSFYTGTAPRCQDPERIHIHLGRGNQVRVTIVMSQEMISHYLEDLVIRADMLRDLIEKKIIKLTQNMGYERFIEKLKQADVRAKLDKREEISSEEFFKINLESMESLNPGRVYHISMSFDGLLNRWLSQLKTAGDLGALEESEQLSLINDLLPTRLWNTEMTPALKAAWDKVTTTELSDETALKKAAGEMFQTASNGGYTFKNGNLDFYEYTTVYPAGTVNRTTKYNGHDIPLYANSGVWPFIPRTQGRGVLGMVDYISPNPGYGYITMLPYQHAGGVFYNAFHNAGVRIPLTKPYLPPEWKKVKTERPPHNPCKNLWITGRGYVSHGCTRLGSGHMSELRNLIPSDSETLEKLKHFRNLSHLYDVFDADGDGSPRVVGVKYYLVYKMKEPRDPIAIRCQNTREAFYPWLYGQEFRFEPEGSVVFPKVMDARFVGRKAKEGKTYSDIALYEPECPEESLQFYLLNKAEFNSDPGYRFNGELRKIGFGHKPNRKLLFLE
jgi:hypothetical protein